jgi:hypothetical protein
MLSRLVWPKVITLNGFYCNTINMNNLKNGCYCYFSTATDLSKLLRNTQWGDLHKRFKVFIHLRLVNKLSVRSKWKIIFQCFPYLDIIFFLSVAVLEPKSDSGKKHGNYMKKNLLNKLDHLKQGFLSSIYHSTLTSSFQPSCWGNWRWKTLF